MLGIFWSSDFQSRGSLFNGYIIYHIPTTGSMTTYQSIHMPSWFSLGRSSIHLQDLGWWWKTSCTTWDLQNPVVNNGINHHSTGGCRISEPPTLFSYTIPYIECLCLEYFFWINLKGTILQIRRYACFCWKRSDWTYMNHKYHPTYFPIPKWFQNSDNPWLEFA